MHRRKEVMVLGKRHAKHDITHKDIVRLSENMQKPLFNAVKEVVGEP